MVFLMGFVQGKRFRRDKMERGVRGHLSGRLTMKGWVTPSVVAAMREGR